ncbi:MAG TPA: MOSC N-terminal beta barrel domain-containing protein [Pirellulales bacterium]|nr:MOSC N-terminal beta barrel domain-containing protein [Pirellulales bacterium]
MTPQTNHLKPRIPIAHLARITVYPIKSLDGVEVERATLLPGGALEHDRQFALVDELGFVNGKRTEAAHRLRSSIDWAARTLAISSGGSVVDEKGRTFRLDSDRATLVEWLQRYFNLDDSLRLVENTAGGFPDDAEAPGPTLVSTATLECVASWFPGITLDEVRRRFRANLEVGGVEPFWEDHLYAEADQVVRFAVGDSLLEGVNPCQRCVVPTRNSLTGEATLRFAKQFAERREASLPPWAARSRFDHFYRLSVNTRGTSGGQESQVRIGAPICILGIYPKQS